MNKSNFKYFYQPEFITDELNDQLLIDCEELTNQQAIIIDSDGNVTNEHGRTNHIRSFQVLDETLDKILSPTLCIVKNNIKNYLKIFGLNNPQPRGISNFINPDSVTWHKDTMSSDFDFEPNKIYHTFLILCKDKLDDEFMVGITAGSADIWNIGFNVQLSSKMLLGHNQYLGHQYTKKTYKNMHILNIVWADLSN